MEYPKNYKYTKEHEWAELVADNKIRIGITDHAQSALGDVVYLELPKKGRELKAHETFGVVESIKAVSDLYSPIAGVVSETNTGLTDVPSRVNTNARGEWMLVIESSSAKSQFDGLMSADEYTSYVKSL